MCHYHKDKMAAETSNLPTSSNEDPHPQKTKEGGYNLTLVDGHLYNEFVCQQCSLLWKEPYQVTCCGFIMCKTCLHKLRVSDNDFLCPSCESNLNKNYFKDTNNEKKVLELRVYCQYKERGCEWTGKVREVDGHMSACKHQLVECPNGCTEMVYPHTLDAHIKDTCPHREAQCQYCSLKDKHNIITGSKHIDECPEIPVPCHNKECQEIVIRREMSAHRDECPKEMVSCTYSVAGCRKKIPREKITNHNQSEMASHLDLAMTQVLSLQTDIEELTFKIHQLEIQQEELWTRPIPNTTQKLVVRLSPYSAYKNSKKMWQSTPFRSHQPEGYKMQLSVACNGIGRHEDTHISCYICLLQGGYDGLLDWPFEGEVTIELLNQIRDKNHVKQVLKFNEDTPIKYRQRVVDVTNGTGWGKSGFLSQSELAYNGNTQYLQDDALYFRISISTTSRIKPWLLGAK